MNEANKVTISDRDWVEVKVVQASPLRFDGKVHERGATLKMQYYQAKPAIRAGQVELLAKLVDHDPDSLPPTDIAPALEPTGDDLE